MLWRKMQLIPKLKTGLWWLLCYLFYPMHISLSIGYTTLQFYCLVWKAGNIVNIPSKIIGFYNFCWWDKEAETLKCFKDLEKTEVNKTALIFSRGCVYIAPVLCLFAACTVLKALCMKDTYLWKLARFFLAVSSLLLPVGLSLFLFYTWQWVEVSELGEVFAGLVGALVFMLLHLIAIVLYLAHAQSKDFVKEKKSFLPRVPKEHTHTYLHCIQMLERLYPFLQGVLFNNSAGETVFFNDKREVEGRFDIMNLMIFPNKSFQRVKIGTLDPSAPAGKEFIINDKLIVWHRSFNQVLPVSACSDSCHPGYHKVRKEGEKFCCYDCVLCPDGKISEHHDADDCFKCERNHYPTKERDGCIIKRTNLLSYRDPLGITLGSAAILFTMTTALVLGTFVKHQDTPLVKANNRNLTYILLVSLLFCFLSALLFLEQPGKVICLLRQTTFGITFSMAVSCLLAKTAIVSLAFMATKPGMSVKKWVGKRLAYPIVLGSSFIQAIICAVWLLTSPPYPDLDMDSISEEVIVQCNEGSITMFYSVLGYLGFLAMMSFILAFLARKLPDSFNETKFITFSMLVFCSIWASFVPTYLSSKGKTMVAVEIFSIVTSSGTLLGFVFCPKCYIIVLRPELNCKKQLMIRN